MRPPVKDQTDAPSIETIDASNGALLELLEGDVIENKDMARQEYAKDADINNMLSKFGITPDRGAPTYGEWDDTLDLQQALTSVAEARQAYKELPRELKQKFGSMEELLTAYNNGSLVIKDGEVPIAPKTETQLLQERVDALQQQINQKAG